MTDNSRQITLAAATNDIDELHYYDWTFTRSNTTYYTHGLHKYPARMPPQIPGTLLNFFESQGELEPGSTVYDPFSGSGTTAVEARLNGHNAIANDINPFACMLSKAKSLPLNISVLEAVRSDLFEGLLQKFDAIKDEDTPVEKWLSEPALEDAREIGTDWFPQPQLSQLLFTREKLNELEEEGHDKDVIRSLMVGPHSPGEPPQFPPIQCPSHVSMPRGSADCRECHSTVLISVLYSLDALNPEVLRTMQK